MTDLTRVPVVVGGGQLTNREQDPAASPDPFALMAGAARLAAASATDGRHQPDAVLAGLSHVWMVHSLSLRHGDPAPVLAAMVGAEGAQTRCSGMGGSVPQWLVNRAAEEVVAGGRPRILVAGAEALATAKRARRAGLELDWPTADGFPETWPPLEPDLGVHRAERAHGLDQATSMYALIETALAHAAGRHPPEQAAAMGTLMAALNAVAAANPHSWFAARRGAAEIMTVSADNRMIFHPYPKYVNAVMDVDMGAAVIVTDAVTAQEWGLGPHEVAYVAGWADAHDVWYLSQRPAVHRAPALEACGEVATRVAGLRTDEIGAFDLYSCFPSSVEVARDAFGVAVDDPRPLTLTGGLPYHGGPGSNYVTHAIVNALEHLRAGRSDTVLVHGNGYYLTKHSVGVYSSAPPDEVPAADETLQGRIDAAATELEVERVMEGPGTVVAYTAGYDRDGDPEPGIVLVEAHGRRALARASDVLTEALVGGDAVGMTVTLAPGPPRPDGRPGPNAANP